MKPNAWHGAASGGASRTVRDVLRAWLAATVFSGIPSTVWALATGGDPWEATRAAGAMLIDADESLPRLFAAAAIVHGAVSAFWAALLGCALPRRGTAAWAIAASAAIALFDLRVVAPAWFPEVAALAFWPQFADHLMWGACFGVTLGGRRRNR